MTSLRETLSLSQAALESTADGILVVDRDKRIRSFNSRFIEIWRIPKRITATRDDARALAFVLDQLKNPQVFLDRVHELYGSSKESFDSIEFKDGRFIERYSRPYWLGSKLAGRVFSFRDVTERRRLQRQIEETAAREQAKIGRDLHDTVGQTITAISFMARAASAQLPRGSRAASKMRQLEKLSRDAHVQLRSAALGLLPAELEAGDLETALRALAERTRELFGVRCEVVVRGQPQLSDRAAAIDLYRIAQEAVSNAVKHSRSRKGMKLLFEAGPRTLKLVVTDSGVGLPARRSGPGLGLAIMRHRAGLLGGELTLRRTPRGGTRVVCECPRPS